MGVGDEPGAEAVGGVATAICIFVVDESDPFDGGMDDAIDHTGGKTPVKGSIGGGGCPAGGRGGYGLGRSPPSACTGYRANLL